MRGRPVPVLFVLSALLLLFACPQAAAGSISVGSPPAGAERAATIERARLDREYGKLPLYFIEKRGPAGCPARYYVQGRDATVGFTSTGISFVLTGGGSDGEARRWTVALDFVGGRRGVEPTGLGRTPAVVSYFKGPRREWKTGLSTYGKVLYRDLWPGIDLECAGTEGRLEYSFVVRPGADPKRIRLLYRGAGSVRVNESGQIEVETPAGGLRDDRPAAYQEVEGRRTGVEVSYAVRGSRGAAGRLGYGFRVGAYDRSKPLVIDPVVLAYCGFIGGSDSDYGGGGIAVDGAGNAYVVGHTHSTEATFPVAVGPDVQYNGSGDAFVAKVNASGTALVYCGYIGGVWDDYAGGVAVDDAGNAYVAGSTASPEASFPVAVGPDLTHNGSSDAYVAKVDPSGAALVYCGYIGGSSDEGAYGIAVDGSGSAYVMGDTNSTQVTFPVTVGPDLTYNGSNDAYVAKVKASGTGLEYCGYIGGSGEEWGARIAVDGSGSAYVTGFTESTEATFPVAVGPDLTYNGSGDAFVAKVNASGTGLDYCGYIGGSDTEAGFGIALDVAGNAYVAGNGTSTQATFPVAVGPDLTFNGVVDVFVAKVEPSGAALVYCGYIGGSGFERAADIAVDGAGNAYVTGYTQSTQSTFPVLEGPGLTYSGSNDAFVAKVNASGTGLVYCGYIGGADGDMGEAVAVDGSGSAYVAGFTFSTEATFPVVAGPDLTYNGTGSEFGDAFVAKISEGSCADAAVPITGLVAAKTIADPDNIVMSWQRDPVAEGYNIWYVTDKEDIPLARQANQPPALPVSGCAAPAPSPGTICDDFGAVSRGAPAIFFYQVRTYCDGASEGP